MSHQPSTFLRCILLALIVAGPPLLLLALPRPAAMAAPAAATCRISIKNPAPGARVGRKAMIEGDATVPPGTSLWGFVAVDGLSGYWPQGGGPARLNDGHFRILSYFGRPEDVGTQFIVHLAVVDEQTNQILRGWVRDSNAKHAFDAIENFPSVVDGCPIRELKVTKSSDN